MKKTGFFNVVLLIILIVIPVSQFTGCKPAKKNIGLQLYSIRDSITRDVPYAIKKVAEMGYTFVEPAGYGNGKFYEMEPAEFRAVCEENGLTVLSSHTSRNLPDSAGYADAMKWWDQCIDAHVAVGAKYIVQPSMGRSAYQSFENLKLWCDYFNEVGEKCSEKGIRFGYHNHSDEFRTRPDSTSEKCVYDFMLENTDPLKVMFEIDLYWAVEGGADPVEYFRKYPGRFELWHIKDEKEIGGSGIMDFEGIWAAADISGMQYGIVEVERYSYDQYTSCRISCDTLNAAPYVIMPK